MENNHQLITPAVDLLAPSSRFLSSSRLHSRMHRWRLVVRRFWWVAALILLCVLGPAYLFTAELAPAYRSKGRIWMTGRLNLNEGRLYTEELVDYLGTQSELLRSSAVQQRALAKLHTRFPNDFPAASKPGGRPAFQPLHALQAFVKGLAGPSQTGTNAAEDVFPFKVKVTEAAKSSILELTATGSEPASTRAFLDCLMEQFFAFKKENRQSASDRTLASVTGEIRQLAQDLKAQQEKLHAFQSSNNVVFLQEQGNSAGSYLAQLNRQIATLRTKLQLLQRLDPEQWIDEESRSAAANSGEPAESSREALASLAGPQADLFRANQQMQLLKAKRAELSRFLRPLHPKILKLNEDIATQEELVQISRNEALHQLTNRRQALQLEITNLESAFQEWDLKAIESSRKIADYDALRLESQRLQTAYDRLLGVMQTVDMGRTVDQENMAVLEPASVAKPLPLMLRNMLLATAIALALSCACLYCLGMFDDRFTSLFELSGYFSEEVLGQIPSISLKNPKGQLGIQFLERQRFEFLESFRNLRSSLLFMPNGDVRSKTILITSSVPREGKSTVALYLSATMALGHARVLLVDADMRRSSLHKFFAARPGPGLAEILSRETSADAAIIQSSLENLWLLPAGSAQRNPGELILGPDWPRLVSELYPRFDYIIIDSPPLLATDDAASLAPQADGVLMIVRASHTSARLARRALDLLRQRQTHVLGLVLNRALSSAYEDRYYHHYGQAYQWRPQPSKQAPALAFNRSVSEKQNSAVG